MRRISIILILSLILQSCSSTLVLTTSVTTETPEDLDRAPAQAVDINKLIKPMQGFKVYLMGKDVDPTCNQAQIDADINKLMSSLKKNSCSEASFSIDKEVYKSKKCPAQKKEGYFDLLVKRTINEEKSKKASTLGNVVNEKAYVNYMTAATTYYKGVMGLINSNLISKNEKVTLLSAYLENVLLPVRDLNIILTAYQNQALAQISKNFIGLVPYISESLYRSLSTTQKNILTQGTNPVGDPLYLEFKKQQNGRYKLSYSESDVLRRDVVTLLKAPTSKNYVLALKWMTLHMMVSQIYLYNSLLGNKGSIAVPKSCQTNLNGNIPSKLSFEFDESVGNEFIQNILAGHGLTYSEEDITYVDYYVDNVNRDPTMDGYSGLIPFENYKNAKQSQVNSYQVSLSPEFDDVAHFQAVLQAAMPQVQSVFKGLKEGQVVNYVGQETFNKMLGDFPTDEIATIQVGNNEHVDIYPGKQNLSHFLLEVMQENGVVDYQDLMTERMKKKFLGQRVNLSLPSLYSSPIWRDWGLRYLADTLDAQRGVSTGSEFYKSMKSLCWENMKHGVRASQICNQGHIVANLADFLSEFRSGETYVPTKRLEEQKFKEVYPLLYATWMTMRDKHSLLPNAKPFALNFILDQMSAGNPWARVYFSYYVALDRLEQKMTGKKPVYAFGNPIFNQVQPLSCSESLIEAEYNNIKRAGSILGLQYSLTNNHATRAVHYRGKEKVWGDILDDLNQRNAQLFSAKNGNQTYYDSIERISYKTILTQDSALKSGVALSGKSINEIGKVSTQVDSNLAKFFLNLYKTKDRQKQEELFNTFSAKNGIDSTFSMKLNFLAVDDAYKKIIYKDLIQKAAISRKNQVQSQLNTFCGLSINNDEQFKNIFYSTTKAQNELNEMSGLPAVPQEVLEKINSMTAGEWKDLWLGIGSGVAGLAAIVIGGACTTMSGGLCAPLGGVMAAAGVSAIGMQMKLTSNEYQRKIRADLSSSQIKIMEDLGFSSSGSHKEVERTYAWAAFEAISIFPLIGVATRSISLGPKIIVASSKSMLRQTGKTAFKSAAKSAVDSEEVKAAHYLLGFSNTAKNAGLDPKTIKNAQDKISRIRTLYTKGEIGMEDMAKRIAEVISPIKRAQRALKKTTKVELGKIHVKESKDQIDGQTAKMITQYFGDNPREMLRLIQDYSGEKLGKAQRAMAQVQRRDQIGGIPIFSGVKDWYLKLRYEELASNAQKILKLEKDLAAMGSKKGRMQSYVKGNIEDITDIFLHIPLKKREVPFFIFVQGSPNFNFMKGVKIPLLSKFSEGQILKKVVTARARLVHESYKAEARLTLKMKKYVKSETTYEAYKAFQKSVVEMISKKSGANADAAIKEYRVFEDEIMKKLYAVSPAKTSMDFTSFKSLVTNPKNLKEQARAEAIWESVPADELMKMEAVSKYAHKAVQELANYNSIDSFERYVSALRILTINRNAAVLDIM